jgi:peptidoglycan hydrolase-like protein with peptidoglycan-binding domain
MVSAPNKAGLSEIVPPPPTVTQTVTNEVTKPPVTTTRTRTRTRTTTVTASPTAPSPGVPNPGAGTLGPGSQGPQVARLQQDLILLGLLQGQPTGTYDDATRAAVQVFQARAGITTDPPGVAGPDTQRAIAAAVGGR